jgi:Ca-activated chloride channel family protein
MWWLAVWPWGEGGILYAGGGSHDTHAAARRGAAAIVTALPKLLRLTTMALLIVALAHPRTSIVVQESVIRGKGMAIALDISTSMLADDMAGGRTRMEVAREAAVRFAQDRELDELTLVAFSGQSVTRVPATTDPALIVAGIESIQPQLVLDGTDISAAVLNSTAELAESERSDRVIVLLTDGAHNGSGVDPLVTARAAAAFGLRVHSIALVGVPDLSGSPPVVRAALMRQAELEAEMETVLSEVSRITGGLYFRASGPATLDSVYRTIAALEAPVEEMEDVTVYRSLRLWPLLAALVLVGLEAALRGSRWGILP